MSHMCKNILYKYIHLLNTSSVHKILEDMIRCYEVRNRREEKREREREKKEMNERKDDQFVCVL